MASIFMPYMCKVLQFYRARGALCVQHCPVDVQMHAEVLDLEESLGGAWMRAQLQPT
jgi:hypothetical protein